jgi:predicted RNA-binding Zn-ribbon protein involved in translation (DUF1610 family)
MASEISVERQFRFHCSCGATIETGEKTVRCPACGITLGVRRVRRHRQHRRDSVAYYGSSSRRVESQRQQPSTTAATPISPSWTIPVHRVEKRRQSPTTDGSNGIARNVERGAPIEHHVLTSINSDFEDHPGDGPHGRFILLLLPPLIALIVLFWRSCAGA